MQPAVAFGFAALFLNIVGYTPYIAGVIRGRVKPQRVTWGIWTILTTIGAVNQVLNHGGYSVWFLASSAVLCATVFAFSIKKGTGGASRFDYAVLAASALLGVAWLASHDTRASTVIAVLIDGTAALPTVVKAYRRPGTEAYLQWITSGLGGLLTIFAIPTTDYILYLYPLYIFAMNGAIVAAKFLGEQRAHRTGHA